MVQRACPARFCQYHPSDPAMPAGKRDRRGADIDKDKANVLLSKVIPFTFKGEVKALHTYTIKKASGY